MLATFGILPQERPAQPARMIDFYRVVRQEPRITQVPLALLVTRGNGTTALQHVRAVYRAFSAGLYGAGNGLVTPGRSGAFRKWFQEVEVRAQLVVLEWKIYLGIGLWRSLVSRLLGVHWRGDPAK